MHAETILCDEHKKRLLHLLLIRTAAVRSGVKPAALLRVNRCYRLPGEASCLRLPEILRELRLNLVILRRDGNGVLVLFYHPDSLRRLLASRKVTFYLERAGYVPTEGLEACLATLKRRFAGDDFPHEVGVFLGYPLKDVAGFTHRARLTPSYRGDWQVFGAPEESIRLMKLFRTIERRAAGVLKNTRELEACLRELSTLSGSVRKMHFASSCS